MKKKKIYAALLAAAMTVSLLAGCGGEGNDSQGGENSAQGGENSAQGGENSAQGGENASGGGSER